MQENDLDLEAALNTLNDAGNNMLSAATDWLAFDGLRAIIIEFGLPPHPQVTYSEGKGLGAVWSTQDYYLKISTFEDKARFAFQMGDLSIINDTLEGLEYVATLIEGTL